MMNLSVGELSEESDQVRFLRTSCFTNLKGVVGLILAKTSDMRIGIPLDLSSRSLPNRHILSDSF